MSTERTPTPLDALADRYVDDACALSPFTATFAGVPGHESEVTDVSPEGFAARAELDRRTLAALDGVAPVDDVDRVTLAAMRERLGLAVELADTGHDRGGPALVNAIESPLQTVRDVVDLMATSTADDWAAVAARLHRVGEVLAGTRASLAEVATSPDPALRPTRRQVAACAEQCDALADPTTGQLAATVAGAGLDGGAPLPAALTADPDAGLRAPPSAFAEHG
ncbi:MAG: hypothetical protein AVDCRST_MAG35-1621, partial [uncultured Quadrisphaera sp.]